MTRGSVYLTSLEKQVESILKELGIEYIAQYPVHSSFILDFAIINEKASVYREMSEGLLRLIESFGNQSNLYPTGKEDFFGIEDLYTSIQLQFEGGEDLMSD